MKRILTIFASILALQACASPQNDRMVGTQQVAVTRLLASDFSRSRLIVQDFVHALTQLTVALPAETELHALRPDSRFGELLLAELQDVGYDLRMGGNEQSHWLDYSVTPEPSATQTPHPVFTFVVSAGAVKLKRSYEVDESGVSPVSSMYVIGATATDIVLDDSLFVKQVQAPIEPHRVVAWKEDGQTQQPIVDVADTPQKHNMYTEGVSQFLPILNQYDTVFDAVMLFPNDSMVMGRDNKQLLKEIVARFNAETDLISVVGCSHGATALANGNAVLANGRAARVKEELLFNGVTQRHVLAEGCWAGVHFDEVMPRRGVVIALKRRINTQSNS